MESVGASLSPIMVAYALENRASMTGSLSAGKIAVAEGMAARWLENHEFEIEAGNFGDG